MTSSFRTVMVLEKRVGVVVRVTLGFRVRCSDSVQRTATLPHGAAPEGDEAANREGEETHQHRA